MIRNTKERKHNRGENREQHQRHEQHQQGWTQDNGIRIVSGGQTLILCNGDKIFLDEGVNALVQFHNGRPMYVVSRFNVPNTFASVIVDPIDPTIVSVGGVRTTTLLEKQQFGSPSAPEYPGSTILGLFNASYAFSSFPVPNIDKVFNNLIDEYIATYLEDINLDTSNWQIVQVFPNGPFDSLFYYLSVAIGGTKNDASGVRFSNVILQVPPTFVIAP